MVPFDKLRTGSAHQQDLTPKYEKNLAKMLELIDVCFQLKEAYHRQQHPEASPREIREMICRGILARKEQQWTSPDPSLKP